MEEQGVMTQDDVLDVIGREGFAETPLRGKVIITLNREQEDGGLILSDNILSEVQYVVAVADEFSQVKAGQKVRIDINKMIKTKAVDTNSYETTSYVEIDPIEVDGIKYALVNENIIKTKINL